VRVRVGALVLVMVAVLAGGCVSGAEVRTEREAEEKGDQPDLALAKTVCDELCGKLESAADAVGECDHEVCDAEVENARDLMRLTRDKLAHARGKRLPLAHQKLADAVRDAQKYLDLDPAQRSADPGARSILVNHVWDALDSARNDLRDLATTPSN
jgi:hypothetical protein